MERNRREFLADVGRAMLVAGVGSQLATDLNLAPARLWAAEEIPSLSFGPREALVELMQTTPLDRLMPALVDQLKNGADLEHLLAAGALANARTFGGEDYVGFHTFMALAPAAEMARELPTELAPLPVLKVLYRNTSRIQSFGGREKEVLHPVAGHDVPAGKEPGEFLREATRGADFAGAEGTFASLVAASPDDAYNALQLAVQDEEDVHRVVLAWRAWESLDLTGREHAHTLLRQSVRYCCNTEERRKQRSNWKVSALRDVLPKLLDQHGLLGKPLGNKQPDDRWIEEFSRTVFGGTREQAAEAAAVALAEGMSPAAIGEAISLAATQLVLFDQGRSASNSSPDKPAGSVHGDSVGVHASDAANAWRNIAQVSNHRNTVASLIVAAYHTAGQSGRGRTEPYPYAEKIEALTGKDAAALLREAETAIRANDQAGVCAVVDRYGRQQFAARPLFDLLLRYSVSEDGALHAEKYYRTVSAEYARTRPAFRWRHVIALSRVIASEHGRPAPGLSDARELLGIKTG